MRITKRQLRKIIREEAINEYGITGSPAAGPNKGRPYLDVVMELLAGGDIENATQKILDSFMMDDTWPKEEMALEDMLSSLGPSPAPGDVDAVAKEWYIGYKAGEYSPAPEEYDAQWKLGPERARARGYTGAVVGEAKITKRQLRRIIRETAKDLEGYGQINYPPGYPAPEQFTNMCMESLDILIGEGNAQGMSFPDIIGEIQRCLDELTSQGW